QAEDGIRDATVTGVQTCALPIYSRAEYAKVLALQEEVARADSDYQRFRNAYLETVQNEPTHEVAMAMIGADMDRAHARLQAMIRSEERRVGTGGRWRVVWAAYSD